MTPIRLLAQLLYKIKEKGQSYRPNFLQIFSLTVSIALSVWLYLIRDTISQYVTYGYAGIFFISVIGNATILVPAASFLAVIALGPELNPYGAGVAAGVGSAVGEMLAYLFGYSFHRGWSGSFLGYSWGNSDQLAQQTSSEWYSHFHRWVTKWGVWAIFFMALIPSPIFDVGGIIAGYTGIKWWKFLLVTASGKSLRFIFIVLLTNIWLR